MINPIQKYRKVTKKLAKALAKSDVYHWLVQYGYFPESYILPPCFCVAKHPSKLKIFFRISKKGKLSPKRTECINVHFPKTELTDRVFGIIHPEIHNDIAYHISANWSAIIKAIFPNDSRVTSYSFPIPIDVKNPGKIGSLRTGRMIYEFVGMIDSDIAAIAYSYTHIVKADIKSFYPSIYTHSIAWAIHGKKSIRKQSNINNFKLLGNRLDKLFQNANDGCTNGVSIGPVVSDLVAEIIATGADRIFSKKLTEEQIDCEVIRFKDDYRILAKSESDAKNAIKLLQAALKEYNLELSDDKTTISVLPDGLFREWVSMYHAANPKKKKFYRWKEFRELYLSVLRIDKTCPGTGVIDRFLSDIVTKNGRLKVRLKFKNLQKVISMLLMLATLRIKAFPKIIAILEAILRSPFEFAHQQFIVNHLESYLKNLAKNEERNKYLISWISYFLVSNGLAKNLSFKPKFKDIITRSIFNNRGLMFKDCKDFKMFLGCKNVGKKISMLEHVAVFDPPKVCLT